MRIAAPLIVVCATAGCTGCYSASQYKGDGQILLAGNGLRRYEIILPPVTVGATETHTFRIEGAPEESFMCVVRVPAESADLLKKEVFVGMCLRDMEGTVLDERKGRLGIAWTVGASSVPGANTNMIADPASDSQRQRLSPSQTYLLEVTVRTSSPSESKIVPVLWTGGAVPWE